MPTSLMTVGPRNPGSDPAGDERAAIQVLLGWILRNYNDVTSSLGVRDRPRQRSELTVIVPRSLDLQQRVKLSRSYSKSSGLTWSRNSRNFSTSRSSSSLLMRMEASLSTSSSAKMGVLARTARAMASLGRLDTENLEPFWRSSMVA